MIDWFESAVMVEPAQLPQPEGNVIVAGELPGGQKTFKRLLCVAVHAGVSTQLTVIPISYTPVQGGVTLMAVLAGTVTLDEHIQMQLLS
jgi:hypothetical protein